MAVFFDVPVQAPYPGQISEVQWHKNHGLLAVTSLSQKNGATVTTYQEEVSSLQNQN